MEINYTEFSLEKCLKGVYEAVLLDARNHGHSLELKLPETLPVMTADRERIEQVILNVLSNAIKYTPDNGRIVLSACRSGDDVHISVTDNGIGIPEEDVSRILSVSTGWTRPEAARAAAQAWACPSRGRSSTCTEEISGWKAGRERAPR
jgi:signal transduction histidine kinase